MKKKRLRAITLQGAKEKRSSRKALFNHDFGYSFSFFSSLFYQKGREKGKTITKLIVKKKCLMSLDSKNNISHFGCTNIILADCKCRVRYSLYINKILIISHMKNIINLVFIIFLFYLQCSGYSTRLENGRSWVLICPLNLLLCLKQDNNIESRGE